MNWNKWAESLAQLASHSVMLGPAPATQLEECDKVGDEFSPLPPFQSAAPLPLSLADSIILGSYFLISPSLALFAVLDWSQTKLPCSTVGIPEPGFDSSSQFTFVMGLKSRVEKVELFSAQVQKKLWKPNQRADMSYGPQGFCWVYSSSYSLGASPTEVWHFWRIK